MKEMTIFWLVSMIVLFVIEAATVNLVTIWFAVGALAALISALAGGPLWLQITLFVVFTVATLIPTRRLAKRFFNKKDHQPTNADMVIGQPCTVTEEINNLAGTGAVKWQGKEWTARSKNAETIAVGSVVTAIAIEGVKLIVE